MMDVDLVFFTSIFAGMVIVILFYVVFKHQKQKTKINAAPENENIRAPAVRVGNRNRMRHGAALNRSTAGHHNNQQGAEESENDTEKPAVEINDPKIGAKKRAKLEAKAEKKSQREADLKMREQRKIQQEKEDAERKLLDEKERLEEQILEEEQKRLQEEKERKEEEEYQKMKAAFTIEEEGFDEDGEEQQGNLLQEFIAHIKEKKVIMLEDVAAKFNLRIQTVITRIEDLLASGVLTGVIDDRGKFIYIQMSELQAVADFVKKRGRVTIQELVENSNNLILLN